jgi:hypothetical protein
MGQYSKAIITAAGQSLIAKAIAGEAQINITKAKTSDYKYPDDTDFKALTDMEGIKQVLEFPETKVLGNDLIQTRVLFSNEEIKATYYLHNIGLFANDGKKEVLFCIATTDVPDEMPQYNGVAATSYIYNIQNVVKDAETIHITVSSAGNATIQDIMERVDGTGGDISETVIENLEPVDTKYPVPSAGESTKVFMGKVKKYIEDTKPLDSDVMIYVSPTGNDTTGTGEHSSPFKTINYALSMIPKVLNGNLVTINLEDGVYDEHVFIYGFTSGALKIQSTTPDSINTNCVIQSVLVQYCYAFVDIHGVTMSELETTNAIGIESSNNVSVSFVRIISVNGNKSCIVCSKSVIAVFNCELSNHKYAIYANDSKVRSRNNIGTGNSVALASTGGSVFTQEGMQPNGNVPYDVYEGSTIISPYGARIGTLANDVTLYVATTGSDSAGDGSSSKPYKTIQYAISILPKDLGTHVAYINIADGDYAEEVILLGFTNGVLVVQSTKPQTLSSVCKVRRVMCAHCTARIDINGLYLSIASTNVSAFLASDCRNVVAQYCQAVGSQSDAFGFDFIYSKGAVRGCLCRYKADCLRVFVSEVISAGWDSSSYGLTYGSICDGGTIQEIGQQPMGAVNHKKQMSGGLYVYMSGNQITDLISAGLSCTWGTLQGGYTRNGNEYGRAMVTIQLRVLVTTTLSAGIDYVIHGFPTTYVDTGASCNIQNSADNLYLNTQGVLVIRLASQRTAGNVFVFNCTYRTDT